MRISRPLVPFSTPYAHFVPRKFEKTVSVCATCGGVKKERTFPAHLEYLGGAPTDFYSTGIILLADRKTGEDLASKFQGISVSPIEFFEGVSLWSRSAKRPQMAKKYSGPDIVELWFPYVVPANPTLSTLTEIVRHNCCNVVGYQVDGVEEILLRGKDPRDKYEQGFNFSRRSEMGIRVPGEQLEGNQAFRFMGTHPMLLEPVRQYIEEQQLLNIKFVDYGATI